MSLSEKQLIVIAFVAGVITTLMVKIFWRK